MWQQACICRTVRVKRVASAAVPKGLELGLSNGRDEQKLWLGRRKHLRENKRKHNMKRVVLVVLQKGASMVVRATAPV